ncbi:mitochondrial fission ELM1 family protein [Dongia mobilis]|nr:ELM1/GtrOC1 family putative glycosyltransferase [Dongia mobilis]
MAASSDTTPRNRPPLTWLILGERRGDNAQVLALARALGWPGAVKQIRYDDSVTVDFKDRGASLIGTDLALSDRLEPPWPEAIIAIGRRSVPVTRWIREQAKAAGGEVLHIHLGRPRTDLGLFDLVVTTPQYNLPPAANVAEISLPIVAVDSDELAAAAGIWHPRFAALPRPWHAVLIGGPTPQLAFGGTEAEHLAQELEAWHAGQGGSLLFTTSPRTPPEILAVLQGHFRNQPHQLFLPFVPDGRANAYPALLALADDFVITIDSASMVAEAATRRKPIYLFDLPTIAPRKKPGLKAALSRHWRLRRKRRQDAGLAPDLGDRLYDAWTRRGKARPRRDIGQLMKRLTDTGIAVPMRGAPPPKPTDAGPSIAEQEIAAVVARIQQLWADRQG